MATTDTAALVRRFGARSAASLVGHFSYRGSSIVLSALAARQMIASDFGLLNVGITIAGIALAIVLFGFDPLLLVDLSSDKRDSAKVQGVLIAKVIFSLPVLLGGIVMSLFGFALPAMLALVFSVSGIVAALCETPETLLLHERRWWTRAWIVAGPAMLSIIAGFFVADREGGLGAFAVIFLLRDALRLGLGVQLAGVLHQFTAPFHWSEIAIAIRRAAPFAAIGVLSLLYFRIDILIMQALLGPNQVARYAAGYALLTGVGGVMTALGPLLLQALSQDPEKYRFVLHRVVIAGLIMSAASIAAAPFVIPLVFGADFRQSVPVAQILVCALPFSFANSVSLRAAYAVHKEKAVPKMLGLAMLVNIVGNLVLMPLWGVSTAAFMTVLTEAVLAVTFHRIMTDRRTGAEGV